ncbi:hypothetical protein BCY91_04330 [Pelobium manganitolerans]|uniref:histidine kinase n=1 Tax=Pelobium manganitolerans TaxID=1842495 RepID=A0A419S5K5_9SPHI|nr:HAMP domain-containing sensor histidine kinase [Pelobium manganitolerans]RKD16122.1 hypothetical protein BCY91_04330 [Pelobium manganitolerans]
MKLKTYQNKRHFWTSFLVLAISIPLFYGCTYLIFSRILNQAQVLKTGVVALLIYVLFALIILLVLNALNRKTVKKGINAIKQSASLLKTYELTKDKDLLNIESDFEELQKLNKNLLTLIERTENAQKLQKEFSENAAHELQTPLAIIKSKLDLMLQDEQLSEKQSQLIDDIYQVLQKLGDLNKNLLFLNKIENQQFELADMVHCEEVVNKLIKQLNFFAESRYQQVLFPQMHQLTFEGNQSLFEQLVQNLLINAIQYSPKGSIINIKLDDEHLTFINEGPEFEFSEALLFSRFSKNSNEKEQDGNGLGLAICKKIADLHGFGLSYHHQNGKHHFTVLFKEPNPAEVA